MKTKKEELVVGNVIKVEYGYGFDTAIITDILPNGERIFRLTGLYFKISNRMGGREWWFVKERSYFWEVTGFMFSLLALIIYTTK